MARKDDKYVQAIDGKKIPILTLDQKWHRLFTQTGVSAEIKRKEEKVNELLKKQGGLQTRQKDIKRLKTKLMQEVLFSMEVCYDLMQENGEQIEQIDEWINQMRIELKKNVVRKQQKELYNQELYTYMHDIFGPDVMELFDLKYQPKLKAAEKEENSGGEKK